jgi:hypothetical protein
MPDESVQHFATLLSTELEAGRQRSAKEMMEVESEFIRRGMFSSSVRVFQTAVRLGDGLVRYRKCIFERWTAYVRPRPSSLPDVDGAAFVGSALSAMDAAIAMAQGLRQSRPGFNNLTGPLAEIATVGARGRGGEAIPQSTEDRLDPGRQRRHHPNGRRPATGLGSRAPHRSSLRPIGIVYSAAGAPPPLPRLRAPG